ncbi:Tax1 binding protein 1 [[Leptolyngbya] sp. PCC 7376]|uniref:hypothetical protein n=1 Tax=[Leptolyngbya] sp. PCC 7376 TaxID=111781 RepID=UPI00029F1093|nr:hypothetical protein [[Leptolyngbya] sp. PCC 7376]AFY40641.1 Tax1 binding protein 1 [[Leptolyngbya] sp. PCC 7376]
MATLRIKLDRLKLIERIEKATSFLQEYLPKMEEEHQEKLKDYDALLEDLKHGEYKQEDAESIKVWSDWNCKENEVFVSIKHKAVLPESKPSSTIESYLLRGYIRTLEKARRQLEICTTETVSPSSIKPIDDALAFYDSVKDE